MGFRSQLRRDFPHGWWHSPRWWRAGIADLGFRLLLTFAPLLMLSRAIAVFQHRDDVRWLAREDARADAWSAGVLLGGMVIGLVSLVSSPAGVPAIPPTLVCGLIVWCVLNMMTAMTVVLVVFRSRRDHPEAWARQDFIDDHAPGPGVPPQTVEEYEAMRLRESL